MSDARVISLAESQVSRWRWSYFVCSFIFYVMWIGLIALPAFNATGFVDRPISQWISLATAILAGLTVWSRLDLVTAGFDKARADLALALARYEFDRDGPALLKTLQESEERVRLFRPGIPQAGSDKVRARE